MIHPEVRFMVTQDGDCCDRVSTQQLEVHTQTGSHEPSDYFYVLETKRWAFNHPDDIAHLLRDILQRIGYAMQELTAPLSNDPDLYKED